MRVMRKAQKDYFKTRSSQSLRVAKALEKSLSEKARTLRKKNGQLKAELKELNEKYLRISARFENVCGENVALGQELRAIKTKWWYKWFKWTLREKKFDI